MFRRADANRLTNSAEPSSFPPSLKLEAVPNALAHPLLELGCVIAPQRRRLDIRRRFVVGARQHGYDREQDGLGRLHGGPALGGGFVAVLVFFWRVKDRDADFAVLVDCPQPSAWGYTCARELPWSGLASDLLLGWKMGVSKRILGGMSGYSLGNIRRARKKPPTC